MKRPFILFCLFLTTITLLITTAVFAHQPHFEESDFTFDAPWPVPDATVSTAVYATLDTPNDVDYYQFEAKAGDPILLSMTIPQIKGQDNFAPTIALIGIGISGDTLPAGIQQPINTGAQILPPTERGEAFFEPFSATNYWRRQRGTITMPADGTYLVAVWHETQEVGRYVFVIGTRETGGGDPEFSRKLVDYWQPVSAPQPTATAIPPTPTSIPPTATPLPTPTLLPPTVAPIPAAAPVSTSEPQRPVCTFIIGH